MNFEPNDQQVQLADSVRRVLADLHDFNRRRAIVGGAAEQGAAVYRQLAGLGVAGVLVPEADGGFGGRMEDLLPVLQACGEALVVEPVIGCAVLGATALSAAGDATLRAALLPGVVDGSTVAVWAGPLDARGTVTVEAVRGADGWRLSGRCRGVPSAGAADRLLLPARVAGSADTVVFAVARGAAGLALREHRLIDDTPAADLALDGVAAAPLTDPGDAAGHAAILRIVEARALAALCADIVGASTAAYEATRAYLPVRQQFGRPIGDNQALRHRMADMLVSLEMARSMAIAAAVAADRPDDPGSMSDLRRAKLVVGRHARFVCEQAVQCHGGIGMTEEYPVGHALRRIHVRDQWFGDWHAQARRLAAA